jgi:hypothetical protein
MHFYTNIPNILKIKEALFALKELFSPKLTTPSSSFTSIPDQAMFIKLFACRISSSIYQPPVLHKKNFAETN